MRDAAALPGLLWLFLEHEHITRAGCLRLDEIVLFVDRDYAENGFVEGQRALRIAHGQRHVRQAVRFDRPDHWVSFR